MTQNVMNAYLTKPSVYNPGVYTTWGMCYKTLRNHNLQEIDKFCSKLVTFGSDKYTLA